ncbi:MAG: tetratricopeptide repeat protein [Prevotella sp.]|nr:tetratricopeptide repeat protein [Prevotella sp.]
MRKVYCLLSVVTTLIVLAACSVQKNTGQTRFWHSFTARYNTYFNGHQAFIDGMEEKRNGNKDDYTALLPINPVANRQSRELGSANFTRAVEKMEKTIKQHSIKARPEWNKQRRKTARDIEWLGRREYNPFLWKAWLMLGQAQFQKGAFDEAAATFSYMSRLYQTQPAIYGIARAWLAQSYTELGWLYDAEDVIRNMSRDSIHFRAQDTWNVALANYYLRNSEYEQALPLLRQVIRREHNHTQKARLWFIAGQAYAALGQRQQAYRAFGKVVAQNPPYELEFNARIAQTEVMAASNARKMIGRLRRMARSDNNKDFLDQVYYAMGNIYMAQGDTMKAISAYEKGNEKSTRNGTEKGVLLLTLGDIYWQMERYNDAQRCYGEAIGLLDTDRPGYAELDRRSKVLDELVPFTDAVHLQDSLQLLARMPEQERLEAIDRVIAELLRKEKEERDRQREAAVNQAQQQQSQQGQNARPGQQPTAQANQNTQSNGQWYFYNQMAVNQGKQTFQRQWGRRENTDNWRRSNLTVVGAPPPDLASDTDAALPTDSVSGGFPAGDAAPTDSLSAPTDTLANDPHNREYYLAQIPFTEEQVEQSNLIIMDGLYHAGVIFKDKLDNLPLSERQLTRLVSQYPSYENNDQALYHLFLLYSRQGNTAAADSCLARMKAYYPESDWTILLSDPYFAENARFGVHIEDSLYAATYDAFKEGRHDVIAANAALSESRFPLGANRPKFLFIRGLSLLNQGDAAGCTEQLRRVVEQYPQSEVSEMAGMIINGVQQGRQLYGGTFDLNTLWSLRDVTAATDSVSTDTLSADRNTPFVFLLVYQPDSLITPATPNGENQLLYEMARFNFSNFLVRNFDMEIERMQMGYSRMRITGFLSFDEALQYARQLSAAPEMESLMQHCRSIVISEHNLNLIGTRYSYQDYDEFYENYLMPLPISDEELLQIPETIEEQPEPDDGDTPADPDGGTPQQQQGGYDDFDDLFF